MLFTNFFDKLKKIYLSINAIEKINSLDLKYIFFSENKSYQKYTYLLIEMLSKKFPGKIAYVSSDYDDYIKNLDVKNFYIGEGFLRKYFFNTVRIKNFILTTTDLGNNVLKKNKNVLNYIYIFHSPVSTFKQYMLNAFDNYDIILCNGNYQFDEIRNSENLNKKNKKKLIKSGYIYFDYLINQVNLNKEPQEILLAPSWNINEKFYFNQSFEKLISVLLEKNFRVRFRPHPEITKRSKKILDSYEKKFSNKNFFLDFNPENIEALENAKCLITDNSGIAIEYLLVLKRPVLYLDDKEKIHNTNFSNYESFAIEDDIKNKFGFKFGINEIPNINLKINFAIKNFDTKKIEIEKYTNEKFYNYGSVIKNLYNFFN